MIEERYVVLVALREEFALTTTDINMFMNNYIINGFNYYMNTDDDKHVPLYVEICCWNENDKSNNFISALEDVISRYHISNLHMSVTLVPQLCSIERYISKLSKDHIKYKIISPYVKNYVHHLFHDINSLRIVSNERCPKNQKLPLFTNLDQV